MTKKQMVTKDNDLIGASYSLGVAEQRLIFLAIIKAREQHKLIDAMGLLRIDSKSYERQFNVSRQTAYEALKTAVTGLFYAELEYSKIDKETGKLAHHKRRWVEHIVYIDDAACVDIQFTNSIIPLITRLDERYTEYELKQVSELQSEYAIRLYELLIQYRAIGKTNLILLDDLRSKLGVDPSHYRIMSDFKRRVLKHAINLINTHTDIDANFEQKKEGRVITGFTFTFKQKKVPVKATHDNTFIKMKDSQIKLFSGKLARLPELGNDAPKGKGFDHYATIIASELRDSSKQAKYHKYLTQLGYS
uniref:replication initiation protein RepM n=1 Tax=Psychrobacter sp. TaxID=56811 RepID=UPI00159A5EB8|nr:replication initiation protein RepM [Psychrobacter sp.]QJS05702.1 replication protein RepB, Rep3 superfamily [Psychrobacter sp.]